MIVSILKHIVCETQNGIKILVGQDVIVLLIKHANYCFDQYL